MPVCTAGASIRIFITGGTGFIGSYVLRTLMETGQHVNVLSRERAKINFNTNNVNEYKGDITDYGTVSRSMEGCETVIHLAALVRASAKNPSDYYQTNLEGTLNMLRAAKQNNVKKFVFVSSLSAHAFLNHTVKNEYSLIKPEKYFSSYAKSKAEAEELVTEYSKTGLSYIIIYPTRVFGIGPLTDSNAAAKAISLYLRNKLPFLIDHGRQYSSWAFVEDVAKGIVSAALGSASNQKYILGGENRTLAEAYRMADNITCKRHLKIYLNVKTALALASVLEFQAKLFGRLPLITREWLSFILDSQKISSAKATNELGYKITPFNQALKKTVDWLKTL